MASAELVEDLGCPPGDSPAGGVVLRPVPPVREAVRFGTFEDLMRATYPEVTRFAQHAVLNFADAEDAVQSAFVKVFRQWAVVSQLTAGQQRAYLYTTVSRECLQMRRQSFRYRELLAAQMPEWGTEPETDRALDVHQDLMLAWETIDKMPAAQRMVATFFSAGHEYGEIADMLGLSLSTVRVHMSNARAQLRKVRGQGEGLRSGARDRRPLAVASGRVDINDR